MAAVQFTNKDDVIEAYTRMKVGPWAIWCGKELNFSCNDKSQSVCLAELTEYLEMLDRNDTPVYYSLRVYRGLKPDQEITNKTEYANSFGFRLTESAAGYRRAADGGMGLINNATVGSLRKQWDTERALMDEVKALRLEVQELKEGDDGEDDDDYGLGKIGRILQHPTIAPMAQQLLGAFTSMINRNQPAGQIAGVPGEPEKIQASLQILTDCIPDFPDILNKLALMAQKNPGQLKLYCDALRQMPL
jgi:hypothetical protein